MVLTLIAAILACIPVEDAWTAWSRVGEGACYDNNAFWWAVSVRSGPIRRVMLARLTGTPGH